MKNKLFTIVFLVFTVFFTFSLKASAYINNENDIKNKIDQLENLYDMDFLSFVNKSELIGYRLQNFKMSANLYSNSIAITVDNLRNILNQIELVKNSEDFSGTQKNMQINKLYRSADSALYELDTRTMSYLMDLKMSMPTITYDRYVRKFEDFYNELGLTGTSLMME